MESRREAFLARGAELLDDVSGAGLFVPPVFRRVRDFSANTELFVFAPVRLFAEASREFAVACISSSSAGMLSSVGSRDNRRDRLGTCRSGASAIPLLPSLEVPFDEPLFLFDTSPYRNIGRTIRSK